MHEYLKLYTPIYIAHSSNRAPYLHATERMLQRNQWQLDINCTICLPNQLFFFFSQVSCPLMQLHSS